ncbi:Fc.00g021790.m01.CDS01 [Cosmosporella sp. VM-42]
MFPSPISSHRGSFPSGNPATIRSRAGLQDALSQIDGLYVGLYLDHIEPSIDSLPPSTDNLLPRRPAPDAGPSDELEQELYDIPTSKTQVDDVAQFLDWGEPITSRIDWQSIREIRNRLNRQWRKFEALSYRLNLPNINNIRAYYRDATGLRESGLLVFREIITGPTPNSLKKILAFTIVSYVISSMLHAKGRLLATEILAGIGTWVLLIENLEERSIFIQVVEELWPEAQSHLYSPPPRAYDDWSWSSLPDGSLQVPSFMDSLAPTYYSVGPLNANLASSATSFDPFANQFSDMASRPSGPLTTTTSFQASSGPTVPYLDPSCLAGTPTDWSQPQSQMDFSVAGTPVFTADEAIPQEYWVGMPGFSARVTTAPPETTTKLEQGEVIGNTGVKAQPLWDSQPFRDLLSLFQYLDNSLYRLSGNGVTIKNLRCSSSLDEEQSKARKNIQKGFLNPLEHDPQALDAPSRALLAATFKVVHLGYLQTLSETYQFMMSIGKVSTPILTMRSPLTDFNRKSFSVMRPTVGMNSGLSRPWQTRQTTTRRSHAASQESDLCVPNLGVLGPSKRSSTWVVMNAPSLTRRLQNTGKVPVGPVGVTSYSIDVDFLDE